MTCNVVNGTCPTAGCGKWYTPPGMCQTYIGMSVQA